MFPWFTRPQASSNPNSNSNSTFNSTSKPRLDRTLNAPERRNPYQRYQTSPTSTNDNENTTSRNRDQSPYACTPTPEYDREEERYEWADRAMSPYSETEVLSEGDDVPRHTRLPYATHGADANVNGRSMVSPRIYTGIPGSAPNAVPNSMPNPTTSSRIPVYNTNESLISSSNRAQSSFPSAPAPTPATAPATAYSWDVEPSYPLSRTSPMYKYAKYSYKAEGQILGSNSSPGNGQLHQDGRDAIRIAAAEAAEARRIQNITHGMPRSRARETRKRERRNRVSKSREKRI